MMKSRILFLTLCCSLFFHTYSFRNLILFIGSDKIKSFDTSNPGALTDELALAIISESAPILVQKKLFEQLIRFKIRSFNDTQKYKDDFDLFEQIKKGNKPLKEAVGRTWNMYPYYQLSLNLQNWYLLDYANSSFLLLLPRIYVAKKLGYERLQFTQKEEEILGLNLSNTTLLPLPLLNSHVSFTQFLDLMFNTYDVKNKTASFNLSDLENVFCKKTNENLKSPDCWTIVLSGHGAYKKSIAGLEPQVFSALLSFFNDAVATNFIYFSSCYAGADQLQSILDKSKGFNYTLICSSALDATNNIKWRRNKNWIIHNNILMPEPSAKFSDFFDSIEKNKTTKQIVQNIAGSFLQTYNLPAICPRNQNYFIPTAIDKNSIVISEVKHRVHALQQKPIVINEGQAAFIYPATITVPIYLYNQEKFQLICMSGEKNADDHIMQSIAYLYIQTLANFLKKAFIHKIDFAHERMLFINELVMPEKQLLLQIADQTKEKLFRTLAKSYTDAIGNIHLGPVLIKINKEQENDDPGVEFFIKKRAASYFKTINFSCFHEADSDDLKNIDQWEKQAACLARSRKKFDKQIELLNNSQFFKTFSTKK